MKKKFRESGLRKISVVAGGLLIFIALFVFIGSGSVSNFVDSMKSFVTVHEFGGQKAFAGEQDFNEAFEDIYLDDDTLIVLDATAEPGDSFWLTVSLTNTILVAGFSLLFEYDTSIICPADTMTDPCWPDTPSCPLFVIHGHKIGRTDSLDEAYPYPGAFMMWSGSAFNRTHLDTLWFNALTYFSLYPDNMPYLPAGGWGPVIRFKFFVRPYANRGDTTGIRFIMFDPVTLNPANTLADTLGVDVFIPVQKNGLFTVGGEEPDNHYPEFAYIPDTSVNEMVTLEFWVTATDEDNDTITLFMDPLDLGDLNYHFDTKIGVGSVTQKFDYTPGFDEAPAIRSVAFKARDEHNYVTTKTVTIQVIETAQDLLTASSQQGGVPGSAERLVPFWISNSVDIYGFQFTFRWDPTKLYADSIVGTDAIEGFSVWDNLEDSAVVGNATVLVFGLAGETIPAGVDTVVYPAFSVFPDAEPGEVDILIENAREAINPGYPSLPLGMVNGKFIIDMFGDANVDRIVDVGDVVSVVAYILGNIDLTSRQFLAADVVPDSSIDVFDLGAIINIILGRWTGPSPSPYFDSEPMAIVRLDYEDLRPGATGEVKVMADLEVPVAGAQIEINYDPEQLSFEPPQLSDWSDKFIVEYKDNKQGKLIVLLYNLSNDPISPGEGNMLSLPVTVSPNVNNIKLEIDEILLADENAVKIPVDDGKTSTPIAFELSQNYPNPFNPSTTIKFTLPSPEDGGSTLSTTLKIYNVLGKVVRTLIDEPIAPGVHHKIWDGRDEEGNQVASGIYFYRLRAGALQDTKKMVLLK